MQLCYSPEVFVYELTFPSFSKLILLQFNLVSYQTVLSGEHGPPAGKASGKCPLRRSGLDQKMLSLNVTAIGMHWKRGTT